MCSYLDQVAWDSNGLVPVVTVESGSGELLMHAWVNREALQTAIEENIAVYWSRSRSRLWRKGEESGNSQVLIEVLLDCDNDTLCYVVEQTGGVACHTGRKSCFHQRLVHEKWKLEGEVITDPSVLYKQTQ